MLINQFINLKVSTRVSTDKNDWNLAYIQVFLMTSDQRVEGSNPSGRTNKVLIHFVLRLFSFSNPDDSVSTESALSQYLLSFAEKENLKCF